jgi:hypothetical protein
MMNFRFSVNDSQGQEIDLLRLNYYCNYSKFDQYVIFLNFGVGRKTAYDKYPSVHVHALSSIW